jgi:hypothetical protein
VVELPRGEAKIFSGYANERKRGGCPARRFDRFLAHVYLRHASPVVVTVNIPVGLCCPERGPAKLDPYNSRRGMIAIARGLKLRTPRSFREVG